MHKISSKEQFEKAKEAALKFWTAAKKTTVSLGKLLFEWGKSTAYALDGLDRWIGSKIKTKNVLLSKMKNHILKIALAGGVLFNYSPQSCDHIAPKAEKAEPETHLVHGIDVSHFNNFDLEKFQAENEKVRNDGDTLTRPQEFIIIRATQGEGKYKRWEKQGQNLNDAKFPEFASKLIAYNQHCEEGEKIPFATYHLYVPSHWVKEQVDNYWETLKSTLGEELAKKQTPILDIEMADINNTINKNTKNLKTQKEKEKQQEKNKKQLFENIFKFCQETEKTFGKKPLIYTSHSAIRDYFRQDERFTGYQFWSAAYGNNNITLDSIQRQWGTNVLNENDVAIHQFTEKGKVSGMGNSQWNTDINVMSREDYKKHFSS